MKNSKTLQQKLNAACRVNVLENEFNAAINSDEFGSYGDLAVMIDNKFPDDCVGIFYCDGCRIFCPANMFENEISMLKDYISAIEADQDDLREVSVVNDVILKYF